jgi:hypothetical protein
VLALNSFASVADGFDVSGLILLRYPQQADQDLPLHLQAPLWLLLTLKPST